MTVISSHVVPCCLLADQCCKPLPYARGVRIGSSSPDARREHTTATDRKHRASLEADSCKDQAVGLAVQTLPPLSVARSTLPRSGIQFERSGVS